MSVRIRARVGSHEPGALSGSSSSCSTRSGRRSGNMRAQAPIWCLWRATTRRLSCLSALSAPLCARVSSRRLDQYRHTTQSTIQTSRLDLPSGPTNPLDSSHSPESTRATMPSYARSSDFLSGLVKAPHALYSPDQKEKRVRDAMSSGGCGRKSAQHCLRFACKGQRSETQPSS